VSSDFIEAQVSLERVVLEYAAEQIANEVLLGSSPDRINNVVEEYLVHLARFYPNEQQRLVELVTYMLKYIQWKYRSGT
jgi:hypothetical protein